MKFTLVAAVLFALSPALFAQTQPQPQPQAVSGSDEEVYAMFVAALEKCDAAAPEGKADYAKVRTTLGQLMRKNPKLAVVLKSPTLKDTLAEARRAVDGYIARNGKQVVCDELKQGIFGPIAIPLGQ